MLAVLIRHSSQADCDVNESRKMDGAMARLLTIGNSGRHFPESKGHDLKQYCNETKTLIAQIESYKNKCLKDLGKQVTGVIVYSVKNSVSQLCKRDSKRLNELISAAPCMNRGSNEINKCYTRYIDGVMGAKHAVDKKKIPHNCCEYFRIFACSETRMRKVKGCNEQQVDVTLDWIRSLFGNVIDLICSDYTEGSDKCAQLDPANAPVVLWLNGGPGCSSLLALATENGPYHFKPDGKTVDLTEHSWNSVANVLYLESPAGTGFSYDDNNNYTNTDESTALDNYLSLESFFEKFPKLRKNEFYITGESYAGVYIPMLANQIYRHNSSINLKGAAIGNGLLLNKKFEAFGQPEYDYALGHGLITTEAYEKKIESCCECTAGAVQHECNFNNPPNKTKCDLVQVDTVQIANLYNIYSECPPDVLMHQVFDTYYKPAFKRIGLNYNIKPNNGVNTPPKCVRTGVTAYMNTDAVRTALHVRPGSKRWSTIDGPYDPIHYMTPQADTVQQLINTYKIPKLIVYNGDFDSVCNFIGDQRFVDSLGFKTAGHYRYALALVITRFVDSLGFKTAGHYREWTVDGTSDGVIGGFVQNYEKGLSFVVVRGAGHMVPTDKPEAAIQILKGLLGLAKL
ncbi:unnamed protein product [Medioppia subpectinata]|uniref:Carboxypeptidase n=1 Tax=Medioppia subpectinata TaxID=1979941 RepID=A0A7R9PWH8_9ACAR|nr:unnamed protein product [Medioppia subpectinata]CAG2103781.1 unnamed protein product [Medioppia subpectinata]